MLKISKIGFTAVRHPAPPATTFKSHEAAWNPPNPWTAIARNSNYSRALVSLFASSPVSDTEIRMTTSFITEANHQPRISELLRSII
ncbi:hypothetical protein DL764_003858 [Monosporascus ibericus]|uniref:Uncharacterized protein n=1 Tax=Monosporascus ibericus TaxID=155417 RepID=A0A4Q4TEX7_9PEZI|nr:hypothetical protein DL764_003858 [Monosporascus ibericus]